jgi:hypothetical protein
VPLLGDGFLHGFLHGFLLGFLLEIYYLQINLNGAIIAFV